MLLVLCCAPIPRHHVMVMCSAPDGRQESSWVTHLVLLLQRHPLLIVGCRPREFRLTAAFWEWPA
jgi:hypothetical protein